MIYAVDFDGTLMVNGSVNAPLIAFLKKQQACGNAIILNTCRNGKRLNEAVDFCRKNGLIFQAVNENLPFVVQRLGYNPRKIFADVYIDDKATKP